MNKDLELKVLNEMMEKLTQCNTEFESKLSTNLLGGTKRPQTERIDGKDGDFREEKYRIREEVPKLDEGRIHLHLVSHIDTN